MRQLHYTLAVILASLLAASSVAAASCSDITNELLEGLLSNEARKITNVSFVTLCDNARQPTPDTVPMERAATVIIEYNCSGNCDYALVDIRCIDGIWNEESFSTRQSNGLGFHDLFGSVSSGGINQTCADCIDMTTFMDRDYPSNPPNSMHYDETTHCLELPMCNGSDRSFLGYFSARECCVDETATEERSSYTYRGNPIACIVHGFEKTQYTVMEGDTVDVIFRRNNETEFPLLTIEGRIVTEDINVDDFVPVSVTLLRREESKTISVTATDDDVALEDGDKIFLRHISGLNNYVNSVEQREEFVRYITEVIIIDKTGPLLINVERSYTVSENNETERNLTVTWQENLSNQKPITLKLTGRSLDNTGVNQDHVARPGQDFIEDTVEFVIPENSVGQYNISLLDVIINDGTVEYRIQSFDLEIKAATEGVMFYPENTNETVTEVAIECFDRAEIHLNISDFDEEDEGPFNVCVIVESEDDDCPVEFDVEYTIRFTRISKSTDITDNGDNIIHDEDQICRNVLLGPCNTTACVDLKDVFNITNDNQYHLQSFNVSLLSNTSRDSDDIGTLEVFTEVREFKIREDDVLEIQLEQSEYYVFDSNKSVEICLKVENGGNEECPVNAVFYYRVHTYGGNATHIEDYAPLGDPYNSKGGLMKYDKCAERSCFYINITDDSTTVEEVEYFNFSLTLQNNGRHYAKLLNDSGAVFLLPKPTVSLMMDPITGNEGTTAHVCASLSYDNRYDITVSVDVVPSLWDDPPTADTEDFSSDVQTMVFNSTAEACVDITLHDDDMVELDEGYYRETFRVTLQPNDDYSVLFGETTFARVEIKDNDTVRVEMDLDASNLTITEGSTTPAKICAKIVAPHAECPIQFDASFAFLSETTGSAESGPNKDFVALSIMKPIKACESATCVELIYNNDNIVEMDEVFNVYVTNSPGLIDSIRIDRSRRAVTIIDDDIATIGPIPTTVDGYESRGVVNVCIGAGEGLDGDCQVDFHVNLNLTIPDVFNQILVFEPCEKIDRCLDVNIDDYKVEENEELTIILENIDERNNIVLMDGTIVVMDDDFGIVDMTVGDVIEGRDTKVCAEVVDPTLDCPVGFPFNVALSFYYNGNSDDKVLVFAECDRIKCVDIPIPDDSSVGQKNFTLHATLEGNITKLSLLNSEIVKQVQENDKAFVGFENTEYFSSEGGNGVLIIWVTVKLNNSDVHKCPVGYDFEVTVTTQRISATPGEDFKHIQNKLLIPACSTRVPLNISIINDTIDEREEMFGLSIDVQEQEGISIQQGTTNITITDAIIVGFTQEQYTFYDNVGKARVCVGFRSGCKYDVSLSLDVTTTGGNADGEVYSGITESLTLDSCEDACVNITIHNNNNDSLKKDKESYFYVNLSLPDNPVGVKLSPAKSKVTIKDSTTVNLTLNILEESVVEGSDVTVCLEVASDLPCPIKFPFEYFLSTSGQNSKECGGCDFENRTDFIVNFNACVKRKCVDIPTNPDDILESNEQFYVTLARNTDDPRIQPQEIIQYFTIMDDSTDVYVYISSESNTVSEDQGVLKICAEMTGCCPVQPEFNIEFEITNRSAVHGKDFLVETDHIAFESCQNMSCIDVEIIPNESLEKTEWFEIEFFMASRTARSEHSWIDRIHLRGEVQNITIEDTREMVMVSLDSDKDLIVRENETSPLTVCADLDYPVDFQFHVNFTLKSAEGDVINTTQGTGGNGLMEICADLYFTAAVEPGELKEFIVSLERPDDLYDIIILSDGQLKIFVCDEIDCVVECYVSSDCSGEPLSASGSATARQCCTGSDVSQSYKPMDGSCKPCIVHGFSQMMYDVEEGNRAVITFKKNVKGASTFSNLDLLLLGYITSKSHSAEECDYVDIGKVKNPGEGPTTFSLVTLNDDIALEYNDQVVLKFSAVHKSTYIEELEASGEFLRNMSYVNILDNDDLEIHFDQMSYEVTEGDGNKDVIFYHRTTEEDFTLTVTPVEASEVMHMGGRRARENICPATKGADFSDEEKIASTTSPNVKTASGVISVEDDNINENPQVFFLLAKVTLDSHLPLTKVCFKKNEKDINCTGNGTALVAILDNDPMYIGFTMRNDSVIESEGTHVIEISSNIPSERDHPVEVDVIMTKSTATVTNSLSDPNTDASIRNLVNGEVTELELKAGSRVLNLTVQVSDDARPEGKECFILRISPNDAYRHDFKCKKHRGAETRYCYYKFCIEDGGDENPCRAEFTVTDVTVKESESAVICLNLTCPESTGNYIFVEVYSDDSKINNKLLANGTFPSIECRYEVDVYDDYLKQLRGCNVLKEMRIEQDSEQCFEQEIIDDSRVEKTEYTAVALHLRENSAYTNVTKKHATITIMDDDNATVGLEEMFYLVNEGDIIEVCARVTSPSISCPINYEFSLTISTAPINAVPGDDYEPLNEKLYFAPCQTRSCINISTIEDGCVVELVKNFTVMLRRDAVDGIKIEPSEASVGINDSDVAYVRIVGGSRDLPVNEGDGDARLFLAVTDEFGSMTCIVLFDFTVAVYTDAGTATINKDYKHISRNVQFSTDLSELVKIRIYDDDTVDLHREETFNVTLQNTPGVTQRIKPVRTPVTVVIRDNDEATFGLERASCKVDEAVTLTVCVVLRDMKRDCPVEFPFDLRLEARAATATSEDHDANVTDITIGECHRSECTNITVYDDSSLELDETFYISLLKFPNHDERILLDIVEKTVTIEDNDHISIIFDDPAISVEGFPVQVCLLIEGSPRSDCPSSVAIEVMLRTEDGTATYRGRLPDYVRQTKRLTIPICAKYFCYNISTIDNLSVENHEYFNVTLTHGRNGDLNERINISTPTKRYEILDDDMAVVEISALTNVLENRRLLSVCLNVRTPGPRLSCPVDFEFTVSIVKEDVTTDAADYDKSRVDVTFRRCADRMCVAVPIINDCSLERDENFTISLEPEVRLTNRIITDDSLTVTIEDDDNTFIEMEHAKYTVSENATQIEVCAVIRPAGCKPSIEFPVRISTRPDSAEPTGPSADYVSAETNLIFSSSVNKACMTIDILDNIQVEHLEESFHVTLERLAITPDGVILRRDEAEVIIVDDDKAQLGFEMLVYTVNEEDDREVEICVEVKSPDNIECPVVYPLEFIVTVTDITATEGEDYVDPGYDGDPFRYAGCARENCFTIEIKNDVEVEDMIEQFNVTLEFSDGGGTAVTFQQDTATVNITDEDFAMVSFTKENYTVEEGVGGGKVRVCAEVVPPVDFDFSVNFTTTEEDSTAVVGEDYTATNATLQFGAGTEVQCIDVPILDDCVLEELEFFKLSLKDIDNDGPEDKRSRVKVDAGESKVKITDEQTITVSLEEPKIVFEDAGTVDICVIIQNDEEGRPCSREKDFDITFFTVFNSADGEDFEAVDGRQLTFPAFHNRVCTSVTINDDVMLEQTESFYARINITHPHSHIALGTPSVDITIVNNDEASVGLENTTYMVVENELKLNVCVVVYGPLIDCPIVFPFELLFVATPDTALRRSDYNVRDPTLRFGACAKRQCLTVDIIDDDIIEDTETFTITLQHPPTGGGTDGIVLDPTVATVTIKDEDVAICTFDRTEYSVQETSGSLTICARVVSPAVSCPVATPFSLTLDVYDHTADNITDYVAYRTQIIEFPRCSRRACATRRITFVNDLNNVEVENVESFDLFLTSNFPLVICEPYTTEVTIHDDSERAHIRLQQRAFTVTEGVDVAVSICAEIYNPTPDRSRCPVVFDFVINLSVDGEDFPMTFRRCSFNACVSVPIDDDQQLERTKRYTYRLERPEPNNLDRRIIVNTASGTLTVIDDPTDEAVIKLDKPAYSVEEENRTVTVCVEVGRPAIDTPIDFSFSVQLNTIDGSAVSTYRGDFSSVRRRSLHFSVRETRECYNIAITNDDTQEDTENFTVTVNRTSGLDPRIRLEDNVGVVFIIDADIATVEFESTAYTVNENDGQVEVCVAITSRHSYCPVAYDFSLLLMSEGGSADHEDYVSQDATGDLIVEACHRKQCFSVGILDTKKVEEEENFYINLMRTGQLDPLIKIGSRTKTNVTIRDDDSAVFGLTQAQYRVEEGQTLTETVCVGLLEESGECVVPFPTLFILNTRDGSAHSTEDYEALSAVEARIPPCISLVCVTIETINDELVEGDENLHVSLTKGMNLDSRISLTQTRSEVVIEDDDSARVTIQNSAYTVNEADRRVTICAQVRSPFPFSADCELDFPISVRLVPIAGTAGSSDYGSSTTLYFATCAEEACGTISIRDDSVMEMAKEEFIVSLQSANTDTRIRVSARTSTVQITDDDDVTIGLQYSAYTVRESDGRVRVCATMSGTSDINSTVRLATVSGTAGTGTPSDFTSESHNVTFKPRSSRECVYFNITEDYIVEEREYFNVTLGRTVDLDDRVQLGRTSTTIFINDNDDATVRLDPLVAVNTEGRSVELCAVVESDSMGCHVEYDFNITFDIRGSAVEGEDYSGLLSYLTIPKCRNRQCIMIQITEDDVVEMNETISVRISRSVNSVSYDRNTVTITIYDNDNAMVRLKSLYQIVQENVGRASVCAVVSGHPVQSIAFSFSILFTFNPNSATYPEDFRTTQADVRYDPVRNEACAQLVVVDSAGVELPESLYVEIELKDDHSAIQISNTQNYGIIEIMDDDVAGVGLEQTAYTMSSTAETVEVCLHVSRPRISCPITFPFDIYFNITTIADVFEVDTNQELSQGDGIQEEGRGLYILLFDSCQKRFCFDVSRRDPTSDDRGSFEMTVTRTPDHGLSTEIVSNMGYIEIR